MSEEEDNPQQHKEQPIIIKKVKKGGGHGHHGGAWKVAYADFVTAMMAFFIVMWILASSKDIKKEVSSYFQEPGAFSFITGKRTSPIKIDILPKKPGEGEGKGTGEGEGKGKFEVSFNKSQEDTIAKKVSEELKKQAVRDSAKAAENIKKMGEELKNQFKNELKTNPNFKEILSSVNIEITNEGLRIELLETKESLFFQVGSAKLRPEAYTVLKQLGEKIRNFPNPVEIEGHTDSRKYGGPNYTNWELSNDRANSARRVLQKYLWEKQIQRVSGFADSKLRFPNNPFDGANRRISILIKQLSAGEFMKVTQKSMEKGE